MSTTPITSPNTAFFEAKVTQPIAKIKEAEAKLQAGVEKSNFDAEQLAGHLAQAVIPENRGYFKGQSLLLADTFSKQAEQEQKKTLSDLLTTIFENGRKLKQQIDSSLAALAS